MKLWILRGYGPPLIGIVERNWDKYDKIMANNDKEQ